MRVREGIKEEVTVKLDLEGWHDFQGRVTGKDLPERGWNMKSQRLLGLSVEGGPVYLGKLLALRWCRPQPLAWQVQTLK